MTSNNKIEQKYKTEMCNKLPKCPYGHKCNFAHDESELKPSEKCKNYRMEKCVSFFIEGYCSYGNRCNFIHYETGLRESIDKDIANKYDSLYCEYNTERKRLHVFTKIYAD